MNYRKVIENVRDSTVFDHLPEEWPARSAKDALVIAKLQKIVTLSLRIIDRVVTGLKGFGDAREKAAAVITQYSTKFQALLQRVSCPGVNSFLVIFVLI